MITILEEKREIIEHDLDPRHRPAHLIPMRIATLANALIRGDITFKDSASA
jgi:hypothetical protein